MRQQLTSSFKSLYFKELRNAFIPTIVLALIAVAFDVYIAKLTSFSLNPQKHGEHYRMFWIWSAAYFTCLSCAILTSYTFYSERREGGYDVLKRLPVLTATVYLSKLSAILTLIVATCVVFAASTFAVDLYFGDAASTTLLAQFKDDEKAALLRLRFVAYLFSALELFCWSAFWATRTRRFAFALFASGAATLVAKLLVGLVVVLVAAVLGQVAPGSQMSARTPVIYGLYRICAYGSSIGIALVGFGLLRLAALSVPIYGIYRQCRRNGATTAFNLSI